MAGKYSLIEKEKGKTITSIRTLPLVPRVEEFLLELKAKQKKCMQKFGRSYNKKYVNYICVHEDGNIIRPGYITYHFPRLLDENNLRKIRFHDLRHSCATLLRHNGVAMENIQKWLGHSKLETTSMIYAHFDDRIHLDTADTISHVLDIRKELT